MSDCLADTGWNGLVPLAAAVLLLAFGVAVVVLLRRGGRVRRGSALALVLAVALGTSMVTIGGSDRASAATATGCQSAAATASATPIPTASPTPTPTSTPTPVAPIIGADQQVSFVSGGVTFYGDYRGPIDTSVAVPAAAIVVGTGDIDRDGNAPVVNTEAYSWIADLLAAQGIASIRYDKLGTGKTGLGPFTSDPAQMLSLSYNRLRVQPARDALSFLAAQPGVDTGRILLLGHSEGGGVAIDIATHLGSAPPLAGLLLVEPAYAPILGVLSRQFSQQMDEAAAAGAMTTADDNTLTEWMNAGIDEIRGGSAPYPTPGPVPLPDATEFTQAVQATIQSNIYGSDPAQMVVSHAYRTAYGKDFDAIDPYALAPLVSIPTLITCGTKDFNTPCGDGTTGSGVSYFASQFAPGVAEFDVIPNMVHIFRDTGNDTVPDITKQVDYPFSTDLAARFSAYVARFAVSR